jgi:DNA-binding transcriptional regulator YbjK
MARMRAAQRRIALVQAALRVIAEQGVAAATTRAIVAEAGMSLASFHYVFTSRDELIGECIQYVIDNETEAVVAGLAHAGDLRTTIRDGLRSFLAQVAKDPLRELAMQELLQYALRTPGLEKSARAQYDSYYAAATAIVTAVAKECHVTWRRPVAEVARVVITFTDGITLAYLVDRDIAAAERVIEVAADTLTALADEAS